MLVKSKNSGRMLEVPDAVVQQNPQLYESANTQPPQPQQINTQQPQEKSFIQKLGEFGLNLGEDLLSPVKFASGGLIQAPILAATGGKVNVRDIPILGRILGMSNQELEKLSGNSFIERLGKGAERSVREDLKLASYAIDPTKGGILSQAGRSALQGGLYSASGEGATEGDIAGGAVLGGVAGPILNKILGIGGGLKKVGSQVQENIINPQVATSATMAAKEDILLNKAKDLSKKYGVDLMSGSAESRKSGLAKIYETIQGRVNDLIGRSKATINTNDLSQGLTSDIVENGVNFIPDDPAYQKILDRELKLITKKGATGQLNMEALNGAKSSVANRAGKAFDVVSGKLDRALSPQEAVRYDLWKALDNTIQSLDPAIKELTLEQSTIHQLAPGLAKSAAKDVGLTPFGIPTGINLNNPLQAVQSKIANMAIGAGTPLDAVLGPIAGATKGIRIPAITDTVGQMMGKTPQQDTVPTTEPNIDITVPTPRVQGQAPNNKLDIAKKAIQMAMIQDLAKGGKNIPELKTILDTLKTSEPKKLSSAAAKDTSRNETALSDVVRLEQILKTDKGKVLQSAIPGSLGAREYRALWGGIIDAIGTNRTGAAYTPAQRKDYAYLLPVPGDSDKEIEIKMKRLKNEIGTYVKNLGNTSPLEDLLPQQTQ